MKEKRTRSAEKSEGVGAISLCFCLKGERENVKGCGERERKGEVKGWFSERFVKRRGRERERGSGEMWWCSARVEVAGLGWLQAKWWPAATLVGSAKERREERRARERERDMLE